MADSPDLVKAAVAAMPFATYPEGHGNKVKLYGLASDDHTGATGAFADLANAIEAAESFIFIVDWSFQPYVRLKPRVGSVALDQTAGGMLHRASAKPGMLIAIHVWDHFSLLGGGAPDDQNNEGSDHLDRIATAMGAASKKKSDNLFWRASKRKSHDFSIHQKFVVLDAKEDGFDRPVVKAFFGGLDITKGRFDFKEHPILPPTRNIEPFYPRVMEDKTAFDDWYNNEFGDNRTLPREPWNDFYAQIIGPAAWDVLREFVGRWSVAPNGARGDVGTAERKRVREKFLSLFDDTKFVPPWESHKGPFTARVLRSIEKNEWGDETILHRHPFAKNEVETVETNSATQKKGTTQREFQWKLSGDFERSIQDAYLTSIRTADRFIYIETQYFIGSGSLWPDVRGSVANGIPAAIARKIVQKIRQDKPFHAYIVMPMFPEGKPNSYAGNTQRYYEFQTMRFMAEEVFLAASAKGKDWRDYLSFHFLANWTDLAKDAPLATVEQRVRLAGSREDRVRANQRYMIYVHSKLLIIDDQFMILGSANLNERSLSGNRDTEICLYLSPDDGKLDDCRTIIKQLRTDAWSRHLGGTLPPGSDTPELASCAQEFARVGRANWPWLSAAIRPDQSQLITFPLLVTKAGNGSALFSVEQLSPNPLLRIQDPFLFDAKADPAGSAPANGTTSDNEWRWQSEIGPNTPVPYQDLAE